MEKGEMMLNGFAITKDNEVARSVGGVWHENKQWRVVCTRCGKEHGRFWSAHDAVVHTWMKLWKVKAVA